MGGQECKLFKFKPLISQKLEEEAVQGAEGHTEFPVRVRPQIPQQGSSLSRWEGFAPLYCS